MRDIEKSLQWTRRRFLTVAGAGGAAALAGCSGDNDGNGGTEPQTQVEDSETAYQEEDTSSPETGETDEPRTDDSETTDSGTNVPEGWDDNEVVQSYKYSYPSWAEIVVSDLNIPEYGQEDAVNQYTEDGLVSRDSEDYTIDTIEVDLDSGVEELRRYISNNLIEDNRDDTVSILVSFQQPSGDLSSVDEFQDMYMVYGIPFISSMFSELQNSDDGGDYPIDNLEEAHIFDEDVIGTFFQDYVSGVRDSSDDFSDEWLRYAEQ